MSSPIADNHISIETRRLGQPTVLARLQALFPTSPTTATHDIPVPEPSPRLTASPLPKSLKIKIVTWNMFDSLPKGDLAELLGKVPLYKPSEQTSSGLPQFPQFPVEDVHPYHLVVIAGQECPTTLGIPMGIGAAFKFMDREKDRDSDRESRNKDEVKDPSHEAAGWTAMTEDWLCRGARYTSYTPSEIGVPKPLSPASHNKDRKGPYQLLIKERMMGLYLAIYIHRDLRPFVLGTSRAAVTAGLIGGRVGNKGGVGISINVDGTSLLFINAHLAAHEGRSHHRLANFAKIKAELTVDDFLSADDPRVMAEDPTDKFDYTFLCGDLNFRLSLTRLHADWLISRQDYAQALAFDQLRTLMQSGEAFVGFKEAPINFPPTFKYDVLRTIKQKRRVSKADQWRTAEERVQRLTDVDEHVDEHEPEDGQESDKEREAGEAASLSSSVWTSMHSRHGTDGDDNYFQPSPSSHAVSSLSSPGSRISAVHKGKSKWLGLLSPASPHSPTSWLRTKRASLIARFPPSPADNPKEAYKVDRHRSSDTPALPPSLKRLSSTKSSLPSDDEEEQDDDKAAYDSSHKKRVPSWCDRVLWKTTIQLDSEPEEEDASDFPASRPRTRMGQILANAFRPLSSRTRKNSYSSFTSAVSGTSVTTDVDLPIADSIPSSPEGAEQNSPFSRFVEPQVRLPRSRSNEIFNASGKPPASARAVSNEAPELHRSNSVSQNHPSTPLTRPRRATFSPEFLASSSTAMQSPPSRVTTPRWRFFPSFLSHASSSTSQNFSFVGDVSPRPPRRGEVLCLNYDTLDDRAMRRLEGRSDHRPVLASYAVFI